MMPTPQQALEEVKKINFTLFEGKTLTFLGEIGRGGQALVLKVACPEGLGGYDTFALKVSMGGSLLEKEIKKSLQVKHDNFVEILGAESKGGINIIAMEQGIESLTATIVRISPEPPSVSLFEQLVDQVGACLSELSKTMVHNDIKPSNILVFNRPPPYEGLLYKLTDLGISVSLAPSLGTTTTATAIGTTLYNSEVFTMTIRDEELTSAQLLQEDTFNFGVTLFQVVCSLTEKELKLVRFEHPAYPEGRMKAILERLEDDIPRARTKNFHQFIGSLIGHLNPDFPKKYVRFIQRMVMFRFEDRISPRDIYEEF